MLDLKSCELKHNCVKTVEDDKANLVMTREQSTQWIEFLNEIHNYYANALQDILFAEAYYNKGLLERKNDDEKETSEETARHLMIQKIVKGYIEKIGIPGEHKFVEYKEELTACLEVTEKVILSFREFLSKIPEQHTFNTFILRLNSAGLGFLQLLLIHYNELYSRSEEEEPFISSFFLEQIDEEINRLKISEEDISLKQSESLITIDWVPLEMDTCVLSE